MDRLDDVTVVELTQSLARSFAGLTLAEYGADVVKIERPESSELARTVDPTAGSQSFYYASVNRDREASPSISNPTRDARPASISPRTRTTSSRTSRREPSTSSVSGTMPSTSGLPISSTVP